MVKVCIQKKLLPVADMLLEIFAMRMADAVLCEDINARSRVGNTAGATTSKISQSHDVFLCSQLRLMSLVKIVYHFIIWRMLLIRF